MESLTLWIMYLIITATFQHNITLFPEF